MSSYDFSDSSRRSSSQTSAQSAEIAVYIDGSCIPQADKARRRAGIGVSFGIGHELNVSEPLLGPKQTSARAELAAAVRAIRVWRRKFPTQTLRLHSDNTYALLEVNRILRPKDHKQIGGARENGDLIKELGALLNTRIGNVHTVKVKAHSNNALNDDADRLAKRAAQRAYERSQNKQN